MSLHPSLFANHFLHLQLRFLELSPTSIQQASSSLWSVLECHHPFQQGPLPALNVFNTWLFYLNVPPNCGSCARDRLSILLNKGDTILSRSADNELTRTQHGILRVQLVFAIRCISSSLDESAAAKQSKLHAKRAKGERKHCAAFVHSSELAQG